MSIHHNILNRLLTRLAASGPKNTARLSLEEVISPDARFIMPASYSRRVRCRFSVSGKAGFTWAADCELPRQSLM